MAPPGIGVLDRLAALWASPAYLGLSGNEHRVFLGLLMHAGPDGLARPSLARLARESGCTPRTVRRILRRLERDGLVRLVAREGQHRARSYRVAPGARPGGFAEAMRSGGTPACPPCQPSTDTNVSALESSGRTSSVPRADIQVSAEHTEHSTRARATPPEEPDMDEQKQWPHERIFAQYETQTPPPTDDGIPDPGTVAARLDLRGKALEVLASHGLRLVNRLEERRVLDSAIDRGLTLDHLRLLAGAAAGEAHPMASLWRALRDLAGEAGAEAAAG